MLPIRGSTACDKNPKLVVHTGARKQDNLRFIKSHLPKRPDDKLRLVLFGGTTSMHFRLRVAQSHFRHDLSPSHFSHAALLETDPSGQTQLWESTLDVRRGFLTMASDNAFRQGTLDDYASAAAFPNICVLTLDVSAAAILSPQRIAELRHQRAVIDLVALTHAWLGFVWGVGPSHNPILDGSGMPCAAAVEVLVATAGVDLTPGVSSRASCPEAIWQAAKWWQIPQDDRSSSPNRPTLSGVAHIAHRLL
jgi:hypothetical protein